MKNSITITKGPSSFERIKTDENGVRLNETETVSFSSDQFLVSDGKSCWLVDEDLIKIQKEDDIINGTCVYRVYQGQNILVESKEIIKEGF